MIKIAVISPHAPILLPEVGSTEDRGKVRETFCLIFENFNLWKIKTN
ncbi:hypothetical protein KKA93_02840 [Patescibacteria group bacterium]|nr:hypothetical protein [Patescibacteria group bacterium]MBU1663716.1 hypothetical protein [Patescibacteria group bacterium]MBU2007727.1 hypothetical protein [Patescibacteria group bacterium]MBU2233580.1 hypothetical protein [Patescibacteria group bacterium]MBU2264396.1 hypothetical protein [Patescibacteria group bacterium]